MKLLIVDDDDLQLDLVAAALDPEDAADAVFLTDPAEAVALAESGTAPRFDVVLLDILMPKMGGIDVCRRLRAAPGFEDVPILMMTALCDRGHIHDAFLAGANDYLVKPFDDIDLTMRLDRVTSGQGASGIAAAPIVADARPAMDGVFEPAQVEAYLHALCRGRAALSAVTAVAVTDWESVTEARRNGVAEEAATELLHRLSTTSAMLGYYGDGVFVVVSRRGDPAVSPALCRRIDGSGTQLRMHRMTTSAMQDPAGDLMSLLQIARQPAGPRKAQPPNVPDLFAF